MSNVCKNAIDFLQKRFPHATVTHREVSVSSSLTGEVIHKIWPMIAQDPAGIKQRAIAIPNLGQKDEVIVALNLG